MDREYRNLLRHAETENDFIKIERIQIRKGLRVQITLIGNNKKEEYSGTNIIISGTGAGFWTGTRTRTMVRMFARTGTRTGIRLETATMTRFYSLRIGI